MTRSLSFFNGLPARLVGLLTFALFPLGMISLYQTLGVVERADDLARAALVAETERAVVSERQLLIEAVGAGKGLAAAVGLLLEDDERCNRILRDFIDQNPRFAFAGYIPENGIMTCSSSNTTVDFSSFPSFIEARANPQMSFEVNERGAVTGQSVMIATVPVYRTGEFLGFVSMSIPHGIANDFLPSTESGMSPRVVVLNQDDEVLSASGGLEGASQHLPRDYSIDELRSMTGTTFRGETRRGVARVFATFTLLEEEIVVVGSWPEEALTAGQSQFEGFVTILFPILMWCAGVIVALFGLHRLVIRHLRDLRDAMRRFALGERNMAMLNLDTPSQEFEEAQRAFNRMTRILTEAEARREQDLHDKEVLLREVHHRVKNNLQLIASMMNMQARAVQTPEAKRVLQGLQRRVQGLAAIHRTLYTTPDMTTVDVAGLADEMVREVASLAGTGQEKVRIVRHLEPMELYPDQAVPLSMVLSEMLTNAVKYIGAPEGRDPEIEIRLERDGPKDILLSVENTKGVALVDVDHSESTGIGSRLMRAFVTQLEGQQEVVEDDARYRMIVRFQPTEFVRDDV